MKEIGAPSQTSTGIMQMCRIVLNGEREQAIGTLDGYATGNNLLNETDHNEQKDC